MVDFEAYNRGFMGNPVGTQNLSYWAGVTEREANERRAQERQKSKSQEVQYSGTYGAAAEFNINIPSFRTILRAFIFGIAVYVVVLAALFSAIVYKLVADAPPPADRVLTRASSALAPNNGTQDRKKVSSRNARHPKAQHDSLKQTP